MTIKTQWLKTYELQQKTVIKGKFIALQSHLRKEEKFQINNLTLHLKKLEKEEEQQKQNSKVNRKK